MARKYVYNGNTYNLTELARVTGKPKSTLGYRLSSGMSVEEAVGCPNQNNTGWKPKTTNCLQFRVVFRCWIPGVFDWMQPRLNKVYIATQFVPDVDRNEVNSVYYTIQLENGKTLIVYPKEFVNLGEVSVVA